MGLGLRSCKVGVLFLIWAGAIDSPKRRISSSTSYSAANGFPIPRGEANVWLSSRGTAGGKYFCFLTHQAISLKDSETYIHLDVDICKTPGIEAGLESRSFDTSIL
jgi:hypothetical protein